MYLSGGIRSQRAGKKLIAVDRGRLHRSLGLAGEAIAHGFPPDHVAVAFYDRVRLAAFQRFLRKERGMNAAIDHPCAAARAMRPTS